MYKSKVAPDFIDQFAPLSGVVDSVIWLSTNHLAKKLWGLVIALSKNYKLWGLVSGVNTFQQSRFGSRSGCKYSSDTAQCCLHRPAKGDPHPECFKCLMAAGKTVCVREYTYRICENCKKGFWNVSLHFQGKGRTSHSYVPAYTNFFFFLLLLFWSNYISIHFVLAYYFRYILNTFATCKSHHSHFWYRYIMIITNVPKHRQRRQWYHQWYWISNLKIEIRRVFDVKWIFSAHTCERCSDIDEEFWCRYMKSYNRRRFQIN